VPVDHYLATLRKSSAKKMRAGGGEDRKRTKAGLAAARRRGVKLGGRKPVLDRKGRERVKRLRETGKSIRQIATLVGVSVGSVHAVLRA
jgi:DNA invertase Pin-like site-specific DNA recombinase